MIIARVSLLLTCSSDQKPNLDSTNFFGNIAVCFDLLKVDFYLRVKIMIKRYIIFFQNTRKSANSFLWHFYGSVISGCVSSNPNPKIYLMHRFTIEMNDDLTSFLSNANTVILVDQMSVSTGEIKCLKSAFAVKKPLQTSRRWPKNRKNQNLNPC